MYVPDDIVMQVGFGKGTDSARDSRGQYPHQFGTGILTKSFAHVVVRSKPERLCGQNRRVCDQKRNECVAVIDEKLERRSVTPLGRARSTAQRLSRRCHKTGRASFLFPFCWSSEKSEKSSVPTFPVLLAHKIPVLKVTRGRISKFEGAVLGKRCYKQVHDRLL